MKKFLLIVVTIGLFMTFSRTKVAAFIIDKQYTRTYTAQDDYVQINEHKEIKVVQNNYFIPQGSQEGFTIFNPIQNDPAQSDKLKKTLDSISVTDNFGNNLSYTTENTASGNLLLKVNIVTGVYYDQTYSIDLSYKSYGLLVKSGALRDLYIPAFAKDYVFEDDQARETVTTTVKIPQSFGDINFVSPVIQPTQDSGFRIVNFPETSLVGQTGWIQIGTKQFYSFSIKQPYTSSTNLPIVFNSFKLVLPRDVTDGPITQKVYFTKFSQEPYMMETDKDGNLIATFRIPATQDGTIEIDGYAELDEDNSVNFKNSGSISDIPADIITANTQPAKYWESDSDQIKQAAASIKGTETNVYTLVEKTYKFVVNKINYSEVKKFGLNERQGALATLEGGAAVCMEYSDLFIALMRAEGIPARAAFGTGYSALDATTSSTNALNHQWAEVYIPSIKQWIGLDTTWGENGNELIGGDLNHFYSHVASVNPEIPSTAEATFYGKNSQLADRDFSVTAIDGAPQTDKISESDALAKYPQKSDSEQNIDTIKSSAGLFFSTINNGIDNFLGKFVQSQNTKDIIKIAVLVLIGIGIAALIIIKKRSDRLTAQQEG